MSDAIRPPVPGKTYATDPLVVRRNALSDTLCNMEIVRQALFKLADVATVGMVRVTAEQRQIYLSEPPEFAAGAVPEPRRVERHNQMFYRAEFAQCDLLWRAD